MKRRILKCWLSFAISIILDFEASGYMATNKYIDGYWVGADGAYQF